MMLFDAPRRQDRKSALLAYAGCLEDAVSILEKWLPRRQGMNYRTIGKRRYRAARQLGRRP